LLAGLKRASVLSVCGAVTLASAAVLTIWRYSVKAMLGERLDAALLGPGSLRVGGRLRVHAAAGDPEPGEVIRASLARLFPAA
jgi:hypothetical protein